MDSFEPRSWRGGMNPLVAVGELIGYGASPLGLNRRTAVYVDKLKGRNRSIFRVEHPITLTSPSMVQPRRRRQTHVSDHADDADS
jgi:hypothetical protein